jgi:hypothetical protein
MLQGGVVAVIGWVRLWHDMPTDPKWRTIARKSQQPVSAVIAVFTMMMVNASANSDERGVLNGFKPDDIASALDLDEEGVAAILEAMQGRVLEGQTLSGWAKRQPTREDSTNAKRQRESRDRKRQARNTTTDDDNCQRTDAEAQVTPRNGTVTQRNAPDSDSDAETETETEGIGRLTSSTLDARASEAFDDVVGDCTPTTDLVDPRDLYDVTQRFARAGGVAIVDPKRISDAVDLVKAWTAEEGATPDVIEKAIAQALADATSPIRSLRYFDSAVRNAIARRRNGVRRRPSGPRSGWMKYDDE